MFEAIKSKINYLIPLLGFIAGICFIGNYKYLITGDGIAYLSVSRHYLNGDFLKAINGYWSPMFSWLLLPFLITGINEVLSLKLLNLIIGCIIVYSSGRVLDYNKVNFSWKTCAMITLIPWMLFCSFFTSTPDLLVALLLLIYFQITNENTDKRANALLTGTIGALAFLTKAYCFWFFIVHFSVITIIKYFSGISEKKKVIKQYFTSCITFIIISSVWIGCMYLKYGKIIISYAFSYNRANMLETNEPYIFNAGLISPPYPNSINILEDYSSLNFKQWSVFDSIDTVIFQLNTIWQNIIYTKNYLGLFSVLAIILTMLCCVYYFRKKNNKYLLYLSLLIFIAIYISGYSLIIMQFRYLWTIELLLILSVVISFNSITKKLPLNKYQYYVLFIGLIVIFNKQPVYYLMESKNKGENIYKLASEISEKNYPEGAMASLNNYENSLYLSYYLNAQYWGIPLVERRTGANLINNLKENKIDYLLVWNNLPLQESGLNKIFNNPKEQFSLYKVE